VDYQHVELALSGVPEQALQRRPILQGARQAGIDVDLHQRPAPRPAELDDGVLLGVQRVAVFDLLGRGRPSISNCSHDTPPSLRWRKCNRAAFGCQGARRKCAVIEYHVNCYIQEKL
jgi:hypothetical protein